ncbi:MAG: DUF1648 domain-containing protein [Candidatus Saccharibacteria bacterium]
MKPRFKIYYTIAILLALTSWIITIYFWDKLPSIIPTHFGISGAADGWAEKSLFSVFLLPSIQTIITGLFIFLYYKPQYANIPSTMWLMTLDSKHRDHAFGLIRNMMAGTLIITSTLFAYLTYSMNNAAFDHEPTLSSPFLLAIVVILFAWLAFWMVRIYRETNLFIKKIGKKGGSK